MITRGKTKIIKRRNGFSLPELLVVVLIAAIIVVLALPHWNASERASRFTEMQRQLVAALNEARHEAISQRAPITFRYDDAKKQTIIYGGRFGATGDARNKIAELSGDGLEAADIIFGRPNDAAQTALADTISSIALNDGKSVEITFQPDGSITAADGNSADVALYFYNNKAAQETAFALSIPGAGGLVKTWKYNKNIKTYSE